MALDTMHQLFLHELKDVYYAEKQLLRATKKLSNESSDGELAEAFMNHCKETEGHVKRVERVFKLLDKAPRGAKCDGILGLLSEHKTLMEEEPSQEVIDFANICAGIKAERYEISAYEGLISLAREIGLHEAVPLLEANLDEEKAALDLLQSLSPSYTRSAVLDEMAGTDSGAGAFI
jgi:ferritin-like metal-binding protein YciE